MEDVVEQEPELPEIIINLTEGDDEMTEMHDRFKKTNLYNLADIQTLSNTVVETNEVGVMLYYGDSELPKNTNVSNEVLYKPHLLQHVLMGLRMLQDKGHMVIKFHEIETQFTAEVLFVLYAIFENVMIYKPFTVSALSSSYYIVCKSLNSQTSKPIIPRLESIYSRIIERMSQ